MKLFGSLRNIIFLFVLTILYLRQRREYVGGREVKRKLSIRKFCCSLKVVRVKIGSRKRNKSNRKSIGVVGVVSS